MSLNKQYKNDENLLRKKARVFINKYLNFGIIENFQKQTSNILHSVSDISYNLESLLIIIEFIDNLQFEIYSKKELLDNLQKTIKKEDTSFNKVIFALNEKEKLLNKQFNSLREKEIRVAIREKVVKGILNNRITNIKSIVSKDYYKNLNKSNRNLEFNIKNNKKYKFFSLFDKIISQHQRIENLRLENLYTQLAQRDKKKINKPKFKVKKTNSTSNIQDKHIDFSNEKSTEKRKKDFCCIYNDKLPIHKMKSVDNKSKNVLSLSFSQKDNHHITYDYTVNDFDIEDEKEISFEKEKNNIIQKETIKNDLKEKIGKLIKSKINNNSKDEETPRTQTNEQVNYKNILELSFRDVNRQKKCTQNVQNENYTIKNIKNYFNDSNVQNMENKIEKSKITSNSEKIISINNERFKLYQNLFFSEKVIGDHNLKNELFLNSKRSSMEINDKEEFIHNINSNPLKELNEKRNNQTEKINYNDNYRVKKENKEEEIILNKDDQGNIIQTTEYEIKDEIEDNENNKKCQEEKSEKEEDKRHLLSSKENLTKKFDENSDKQKMTEKAYEEEKITLNEVSQKEIQYTKNNIAEFEEAQNILICQPPELCDQITDHSDSKNIRQKSKHIKDMTEEKKDKPFENVANNNTMKSKMKKENSKEECINSPNEKLFNIQIKDEDIPAESNNLEKDNIINSQPIKSKERIQPQDIEEITIDDNNKTINSEKPINENQKVIELIKWDEENLIQIMDKTGEKQESNKELLNEENKIFNDEQVNLTIQTEKDEKVHKIDSFNNRENNFEEGTDDNEAKSNNNHLQNVTINEESNEISKVGQIDNKKALDTNINDEIIIKNPNIPLIRDVIVLDNSFGSTDIICQETTKKNNFDELDYEHINKENEILNNSKQNEIKNINSNQELRQFFDKEELNQEENKENGNIHKKKVMFKESIEEEQRNEEKNSLLFNKTENIPFIDTNQFPVEEQKTKASQPINSIEIIKDSVHSSPIIKSLSQISNSGQFIIENDQLSQIPQLSPEKKNEKLNSFDSNQQISKKNNSTLFLVQETQYNIYYDDNSEYSRKTAFEPGKRPHLCTGEDNILVLSKENNFCINQNLRKTANGKPFKKKPLIKPGIKEFDFWGLFNFWDKKNEKPKLIKPIIKSNLGVVIADEKTKKGYEKIKTLIMKRLHQIYTLIKNYNKKKEKLFQLFWKYSKKILYVDIIIKIFGELKVKNDNFIFSTISEDMINSREDINYTKNLKEIQKITKETKIIEANLAKFTNEIGVKSKL